MEGWHSALAGSWLTPLRRQAGRGRRWAPKPSPSPTVTFPEQHAHEANAKAQSREERTSFGPNPPSSCPASVSYSRIQPRLPAAGRQSEGQIPHLLIPPRPEEKHHFSAKPHFSESLFLTTLKPHQGTQISNPGAGCVWRNRCQPAAEDSWGEEMALSSRLLVCKPTS